jgi:hypothetical protein
MSAFPTGTLSPDRENAVRMRRRHGWKGIRGGGSWALLGLRGEAWLCLGREQW